jgi:hypothetical protein
MRSRLLALILFSCFGLDDTSSMIPSNLSLITGAKMQLLIPELVNFANISLGNSGEFFYI